MLVVATRFDNTSLDAAQIQSFAFKCRIAEGLVLFNIATCMTLSHWVHTERGRGCFRNMVHYKLYSELANTWVNQILFGLYSSTHYLPRRLMNQPRSLKLLKLSQKSPEKEMEVKEVVTLLEKRKHLIQIRLLWVFQVCNSSKLTITNYNVEVNS